MIGDTDIRDFTIGSLRRRIGVIPQDITLFNDTLANNMRYGFTEAEVPDSKLMEIARWVQLEDLVHRLPEGLQTVVGERGLKLSYGERQRLAIGRALVKTPDILILDEATSALDTKLERSIMDVINKVSSNRTTLMIAHRLSTVVDCDLIVVVKEGHVVERGTHWELLSKKGLYWSMWNAQDKGHDPVAA
jgi:ATP-binding cassette subfamily B protein